MNKMNKTAGPVPREEAPAWEQRHAHDAREPLADNTSGMPDRSSKAGEGLPGEIGPTHATGYQTASGAVHPDFPDQASGQTRPVEDEKVEERARRLWEKAGRPDGGLERYRAQAEQELNRVSRQEP